MKKKVFRTGGIALAILIASALAAFGILTLIRNVNVSKTGNILGVAWYNETDKEFTITTVEQLYEFAELSRFYTFEGQTVKLGADIIFNEGNAKDWSEKAPGNRWRPIQNFAGTFDGQNHTLSGLYGRAHQTKYAMFTDLNYAATIRNLKLTNTYFETSGSMGIASIVSGGGGKFVGLYSDAILNHRGENVGGIASQIVKQSTFDECWFAGTISTTTRTCGGIVDVIGETRVQMKHCLVSGVINQSFSADTVSTMQARTGGMIGVLGKNGALVLTDCLMSGKVNCNNTLYTGGLIGATTTGSQTMIRDTYVSSDSYNTVIGITVGSHDGVAAQIQKEKLIGMKAYQWTTLDFKQYWSVIEDEMPVLKRFGGEGLSTAGVEKEFDTSWYMSGAYNFEISNVKQLLGLYYVSTYEKFVGKTVQLVEDIEVNAGNAKEWGENPPEYVWTPIENFAGVFDGQGHTVSGIYINTNKQFQGMFGKTGDKVVIKNFNLKNSYFNNYGTGTAVFASVVAELRGEIENVYSDATVISTGAQVGGIVGRVNDSDSNGVDDAVSVRSCWFDGEVQLKGENTMYAGGVIGWQVQGDLEILHCLNTGTISSEKPKGAVQIGGIIGLTGGATVKIQDSLNVGSVVPKYGACVGSVIGRARGEEQIVTLSNTYATTESYAKPIGTSSTAIINGGVIQLEKTWFTGENAYRFTELDFPNYWAVVKNSTPVLQYFAGGVSNIGNATKLVDTTWYSKDAKELIIDSVADLYGFSILSRTTDFKGQTVKVAKDLAINGAWQVGTTVPDNKWLVISPSSVPFAGTFDAQGHTISGLYMDTKEHYSGFFGKIGETGIVKNLKITNSYFLNTDTASNVFGSAAGELAGVMENVYSNATVISHGNQGGGLLGRTNDIDEEGKKDTDKVVIKNCWFDGTFIFRGKDVRYGGGITGLSNRGDLDIINCLNTGKIADETTGKTYHIGGIIGTNSLTGALNIKDCLNSGEIAANYAACVGSIIGQVRKTAEGVHINNTYATVESHSYTLGNTSVMSVVDGGVVRMNKERLIGNLGYQMTNLDFVNYWAIRQNDTPALKTFVGTAPALPANKLVDISWYNKDAKLLSIDSKEKLMGLAILALEDDFEGQTVQLTADITLDAGTEWIPIANKEKPFAGTFDGQGHKIYNMTLASKTGKAAMFAATSGTSVLQNFSLMDAAFSYTGPTDSKTIAYVASICAEFGGSMKNVFSNATITSTASRVGGLVAGANNSTKTEIKNCWFDGTIAMKGAYAKYAGGIAGIAMNSNLTIENSLNTGTISCEATGANFVGGILGADITKCSISIKDCLSTGTVTSTNETYSGVGSAIGIGYIEGSKYSLEHVYVLDAACQLTNGTVKTSTWFKGVEKSGEIKVLNIDRLAGVQGFHNTLLDFGENGPWTARKKSSVEPHRNSVPALKAFVDAGVCESVAGLVRPEETGELVADVSWFNKEKFDNAVNKTYTLVNENQLVGFAKLINDGTYDFAGWHIVLGRNMELGGATWTPIGSQAHPFKGRFDGDHNTISGLNYNVKNAKSNTVVDAGLFGYTEAGSIIENVKLVNSTFKVFNGVYMGSIVGRSNGGTIRNVYSDATVIADANSNSIGQFIGCVTNNITLENCWSAGRLETTKTAGNGPTYVGGFIGYAKAPSKTITVTNCLHTGSITNERTANYPRVGGFCGLNDQGSTKYKFTNYVEDGTITVASAKMVGLLFGQLAGAKSEAEFTNCYVTGTLKDSTKEYPYVIQWSAATAVLKNVPTITTKEILSTKTVEQLFPTHSNLWEKVDGKIPFVLKSFTEYVKKDGE